MHDLQFADGMLARLRAKGGERYDARGYLFLLAAVEYLQEKLDVRRHVSGAELAWACRDLAHERFGLLARTVLDCWGIRSTADFGHMVFTMVDAGLLSTQPGDRAEDFADVYEFTSAFEETYAWSGKLMENG